MAGLNRAASDRLYPDPTLTRQTSMLQHAGTPLTSSRNWLGYLCDALVASGTMPTWEAATYLTGHLFVPGPNPRLYNSPTPYESISQFLRRIYDPIVDAAARSVAMPRRSMIHTFMDVSLTGNSAVLVVYFPGGDQPHELLFLDAARAWDLTFDDTEAFNRWAEQRYQWVMEAIRSAILRVRQQETVAFLPQ